MGLPISFFGDAPFVEREPAELKHLSRQRKRKQYAMPLVTSSENGCKDKLNSS